ncbi:hypothetical protein BJX64DRAFT_261984 [Aspergillus heterothallicus]
MELDLIGLKGRIQDPNTLSSDDDLDMLERTFVDRLARFLVAFTGGVFLIVPTKSFVVVSVTVLLFTFVLSFAVCVSNVETLVAAATYAAVMVVFLGATNGNTAT